LTAEIDTDVPVPETVRKGTLLDVSDTKLVKSMVVDVENRNVWVRSTPVKYVSTSTVVAPESDAPLNVPAPVALRAELVTM
jgi:hypothetical protein